MNKINDRKTKKDIVIGYIRNGYIRNNKVFVIVFIALLIGIVTVYNALATVYPSYNTEQDCRGCHGVVTDRHHLLVPNGIYQCTDCHAMKFDSQNQTYYPEIIRNCLICHPGKDHTDTHHIFVSQGLFVCIDCHPMLYDEQNQTYYPRITWDCTVCHSTVLSIQNGTPGPTPTPTPTPTPPIPPSITTFSPISPVKDIVGNSRDFRITTDQIVNVTWFIDDIQIQSNESVAYANYSTSAGLGLWNVSAVASNINGTVKYTWTWNVTMVIIIPPVITFYAPYSPINDIEGTPRKFGIAVDQVANIVWYIDGVHIQSNYSIMGANYTNTGSPPGIRNVDAIVSNTNGSVSHSWTWNVVIESRPNTTIDPPNGQNGWYKTNTVYLNVTDSDGVRYTNYSVDGGMWNSNPGSGVNLRTPITLSDGNHSVQYYSVDNLGGIESTKVQLIKVDSTIPQITINSPINGTVYIMNQNLIADWSVSDATSGIVAATGTYPNGGIVNTTSTGTKNFSVSATDNAGNIGTKNVTYYIRYNFGRFLEPINNDGSSIFKLGSTVPIKFQLTDANGNYVTSAVAILNLSKVTSTITGTYLEPYTTGSGTTGYVFIYETNGNRYSYNLMTKPLSVGTWRIRVDIDDGSSYVVNISLRK